MHSEKIDKSTQPEAKKSVIDISPLDNCIDETNNLEPLYENLYQQNKVKYDRKSDLARDEKILDELTRAADEIMNVSFNYNRGGCFISFGHHINNFLEISSVQFPSRSFLKMCITKYFLHFLHH